MASASAGPRVSRIRGLKVGDLHVFGALRLLETPPRRYSGRARHTFRTLYNINSLYRLL